MKGRDTFVVTQRVDKKLFGPTGSSSRCWTLPKQYLGDFQGRKGFVPILSLRANPSLIGGILVKSGKAFLIIACNIIIYDDNIRRLLLNVLMHSLADQKKYQGPRGSLLIDPQLSPPIRVVSLEQPYVDKDYVRYCMR